MQLKNTLLQFGWALRANDEPSERGIESLNGEQSQSAAKESLLPEGEGQDEGEPRSMTQRQNVSAGRHLHRSGLDH